MYKTIPHTDNTYECNEEGTIRRKTGIVPFGTRQRKVGGAALKPKTKKNGYQEVALTINRKHISRYVHRLVAQTFLGDIPKGYNVNHKDGNKANNQLNNLEIVTYSQNTKHAYDNGAIKLPRLQGEAHPLAKLTEKDVYAIRELHKRTGSIATVRATFNHVPRATVDKVAYYQTWKHLSQPNQ